MANKRINVADLSFDDIRGNLKSFMEGQSEFSDYNFEGSGLSVLLDVLAYNTHYNALYTNLAVNESFLDSASKRSNVVSIAKSLGYTPRSATAPRAVVDVRVTSTSSTPATLNLPKYSTFTTTISGQSYTFYTIEDYTTYLDGSQYLFQNVNIREGTQLSFKYTAAAGQRYIIPNAGADLATLTVQVQESAATGLYRTYSEGSNILGLTSTSEVYFVKEIENELYEVVFGDGTIGKALSNGNVITLNYIVTNKDAANSAKLFTYTGASLIGGTVTASTVSAASGGTDIEDIESVRFNAPRHYSTQNRGVTSEDYKSLITEEVSNVEAVSVWGGEDNDPPVYGKVYCSIKPVGATALTAVQKSQIITEVLKPRNVVSITPEIIDPEYIHVAVNSAVYYNPRLTTRSAADIKAIVEGVIQDYNTTDLEKFDSVFRISKLSRLIDASDPGIVSNITKVTLHKPISPVYGVDSQYKFNIINPIYSSGQPEDSITTTPFYMHGDADNEYYIDDDGKGNLRLYYLVSATERNYVNNNIGTVTYSTGTINVPTLNITTLGIGVTEFKFFIKPSSYDVVTARNQISVILNDEITVSVITDSFSLGNTGGGTNYTFTTSRS